MSNPASPLAPIVLHGRAVSVVLEPTDGAPIWRYWGPRLPEDCVIPPMGQRPEPSFSLNTDVPLSIFPTFGVGWFGPSGLLAHREGRDFAQCWTGCSITWLTPMQHVEIALTDDVACIGLTIVLRLDPDADVLRVQTRLDNAGTGVLDVLHLAAACLPLPHEPLTLQHYVGRHNSEFQRQDDHLGRGGWRRENRRGLTSHNGPCGAVVLRDDGSAWGAQLVWSGNSTQSIDWIDEGAYVWQMGAWFAPGEIRLGAGESFTAPEVLATFSPDGTDGVAQNFHAAIRVRIQWPDGEMKPRPVHLNTWEGFYFDHDLTALKDLAVAAAAIGIERFVLDDGWFHRRDDDTRALGDWWPDETKYPEGLMPLATAVTDLGMEFGLWVEPEMVNPDSALFQAHPGWALQIAGRPLLTARNQLVLDLTRPEVADYLFECVDALLRDLPITYLKWDHNRDLTTAGNVYSRAAYDAHVRAAYAFFDRIRAAYPAVEIEACAGGGGRIDAGIIARTHRFWPSDCIDAVSRLPIQQGFLQFMPPEVMGAHVGTAPAHSTGRSQSIDFRAAVALPGHFGVELDVRGADAAERARLAHWIALYKRLRYRLHHGAVYRGQIDDGLVWQAHGDTAGWVLFVYRLTPTALRQPPHLRLPFLDPAVRYRVTQIEPSIPETRDIAGAWLHHAGLPLVRMAAESAILYDLRRIDV